MPWVAGAAVIGAVGSVAAGSMQAKAAKKAGQQQQQGAADALAFQREQYANSFRILSKYGVQGDWARNQIAAFMGAPQTQGDYSRPEGAGADYDAYVQQNPDMVAEWAKPGVRAQFGGDRAAYGRWHAETYPGEREVPQTGGGGPNSALGGASYKTPDELREEAWDNYTKTPWATIGQTNAKKAQADFTSMAGAQGSALSGRTARGLAEVGNEMEQEAFGAYTGMLGGVADMGFNADSGIASGGQVFANNASNLTTAAADARARSTVGQADAWSSAISDAAGWAGWAAGNAGLGTGSNRNTSQVTYSSPSSGGRGRSGGLGRIQ